MKSISKYTIAVCVVAIVALGAGCSSNAVTNEITGLQSSQPPVEPVAKPMPPQLSFPGALPKDQTDKRIRIHTDKGDIVIDLLPDEGPNAASNFVYLVQKGFYNGLTFHRVEPHFVVQGGDPSGDGTGGPGYTFHDDQIDSDYDRGIVAMANRGPNTNGSQFFIMLENVPLPAAYSIFGRVVEGMDVVDTITIGDVMKTVTLEDKPAGDASGAATSTTPTATSTQE
jgi:peptidyl-prolyl cis-trans isomerase B (cyclophilin B)